MVLSIHNVAGRAPASAVGLEDQMASNDHASIRWSGARWEVRDLGSRNGTFIGATRVAPKENAHLARGGVLKLGCDAEQWELVDDRGPVAIARCAETGEVRAAEGGLLALPSLDELVVSVVEDAANRWFVEAADGVRQPAVDGASIRTGDRTWELTVPPASPLTGTFEDKPALSLATIALRFHVSLDEEHVRIDAVDGARVVPLGERAGFYMLLVLARRRIEEAQGGALPEAERGWYHVIDLLKALGMEERNLNVTVFRLREVFAKAGVDGAEGIVQRRSREIRIGTGRLEEIKA